MLTTTYQNASIIGLRITNTFRWLIKVAYQFQITAMNDKSEWPKVNPGFEMIPPKLQMDVGRPRKGRSRLEESQEKDDHINAKGAFSLDI